MPLGFSLPLFSSALFKQTQQFLKVCSTSWLGSLPFSYVGANPLGWTPEPSFLFLCALSPSHLCSSGHRSRFGPLRSSLRRDVKSATSEAAKLSTVQANLARVWLSKLDHSPVGLRCRSPAWLFPEAVSPSQHYGHFRLDNALLWGLTCVHCRMFSNR